MAVKKSKKANQSTRKSLINAAAKLFADQGIESVSLRDITSKAKLNIASVNYHFGTKDHLVKRVGNQIIAPVFYAWNHKFSVLEDAIKRSGISQETMIADFTAPIFDDAHAPRKNWEYQLLGRVLEEPNTWLPQEDLLRKQDLMKRFQNLLMRSSGQEDIETIRWQVYLLMGALIRVLRHGKNDDFWNNESGEEKMSQVKGYFTNFAKSCLESEKSGENESFLQEAEAKMPKQIKPKGSAKPKESPTQELAQQTEFLF